MRGYLLIGCVCLAAYLLYIPLPEGYEDPWNTRLNLYILGFVNTMNRIANVFVNYDHPRRFTQQLYESQRKLRCEPHAGLKMKISDQEIDGVPVRVYDPVDRLPNSGAIVYIHGGGWVMINIDVYDCFVQDLAHRTGLLVVSVEYRLAPEHKYPAAVDDCEAVTKYLLSNAVSYNINSARVAVAGDSAGGHLSAVVSMKLRDEDFPLQPTAQILIYPITQAFDFKTPSYTLYGNYPHISTEHMILYWNLFHSGNSSRQNIETMISNGHVSRKMYQKYSERCDPQKLISKSYRGMQEYKPCWKLSDNVDAKFETMFTNPYMSPLLAENLSGLPKAFVLTSEIDVLRDDGLMYATRLREAGNDVTHKHYFSSNHGFLISNSHNSLKIAPHALDELIDYIKINV